MVNHEIINKILNTSHDKAVGEFLDAWGESADDPTTALVSIAASLREIVAQLQGIQNINHPKWGNQCLTMLSQVILIHRIASSTATAHKPSG